MLLSATSLSFFASRDPIRWYQTATPAIVALYAYGEYFNCGRARTQRPSTPRPILCSRLQRQDHRCVDRSAGLHSGTNSRDSMSESVLCACTYFGYVRTSQGG